MTARFRALSLLAPVVLFTLALPAAAQTPDFGTDSSPWANDGECDDPRFQGPGMASTPLLETDIRADATDCRSAFNAGTVSLIGGTTTGVTTAPGKTPPGQTTPVSGHVIIGGINFGDDSGEWPFDGECDDRRFVGTGMALGLPLNEVGRDATDCRSLYDAGRITLWDFAAARAATQCDAISFGNDSGDYANDAECDDPRFDGPAASYLLNPEWNGRDATDCSRMCAFGMVALRDY